MAKSSQSISPKELCDRISRITNLAAYTRKQFIDKTVHYFLTRTGIPINFGFAIVLGFLIGVAISGQTFYNFTFDFRAVNTFLAEDFDDETMIILLIKTVEKSKRAANT